MQLALDAVRTWMLKQGYAVDEAFPHGDEMPNLKQVADLIREKGQWCMHMAETYTSKAKGTTKEIIATRRLRYLRLGLIAEELAELFDAFAIGDEVLVLDALADLQYVIYGTAVAWDLPLGSAFAEVHLSNDTKDVADGKEVRAIKGEKYREPKIAETLKRWREAKTDLQRRGQSQNIMEALRRTLTTQFHEIERGLRAENDDLRARLAQYEGEGL